MDRIDYIRKFAKTCNMCYFEYIPSSLRTQIYCPMCEPEIEEEEIIYELVSTENLFTERLE